MTISGFKYSYLSKEPEETLNLGKQLAAISRMGDIIALFGELGTGKTVIAKGIAEGLGIKDVITSPTFTLLNIYEGKMRLYHYDWYRLETLEDLESAGVDDYLKTRGLVVIEWADKGFTILPDGTDFIKIEFMKKERERLIRFNNIRLWKNLKN